MTYPGAHIPPARNASYPLRMGNTIAPLIDGGPAFRRIAEAVENAKHSVWVTVAYLAEDFMLPDEYGSFFDLLDRTKNRGVDVRVIFWRSPVVASLIPADDIFHGFEKHRKFLSDRETQFLIRWDRLEKTWCHHQKSWLIDAGKISEVAFVGGINLGKHSVVEPGHKDHADGSTHDVYVEVCGPAATDVHHNFVQRWNEASEKDMPDGIWPEKMINSNLPFPKVLSPTVGKIPVQVSRTVRRESYKDTTPALESGPFPIIKGEFSCLEQYLSAIEMAQETIYIEDQALGSQLIIEKFENVLERGIEIVFVLPGKANGAMVRALTDPRSKDFIDRLQGLGRFPNFTMAALAADRGPGKYLDVYVHAKIAIVDGVWATIGSCNVADRSFYSDTELNASFWDKQTVRNFRNDLFKEHLGVDISNLTDMEALKLFKETARDNTMRRVRGEKLQGLAFQLDPNHYPSVDPWLPPSD